MTNKIFVPLAWSEHNQMGGEALFATKLRAGVYRVDCVPLFAPDLHHGDVVRCDESNPDRIPVFQSVLERSDLVTVHLLFTDKGYRSRDEIITAVQAAGFHVEAVAGKLYAVNAPRLQLRDLDRLLRNYPESMRWWLDGQEDNPFQS